VQLDLDPQRIGLRYPVEVGLVGDSAATLRELMGRLKRNKHRGFLEKAQKGMREWRKLMETRATRRDMPMKPQVVAHELGLRLTDDAIVCCDSGTVATWFARHIPARRGQMYSLSGNLASMANGLPYAIGAAIAYPKRMVVAFVGDGACSMLMAELATLVKYQLNVKVVVIKNNCLGQIKWEQLVMLGNPEYGVELHPIDFAAVARACGAVGLAVAEPAECGHAMEQALATPGPVLLEASVDPYEPPMPANITLDQAKKFAESLVRGEPAREKIVRAVLKDKIKELI
jgi:pyruvate dehydrogenase (quinone)